MAGWIKIRADVMTRIEFLRLEKALGSSEPNTLCALVRVAGWFEEYSKYGKIETTAPVIDSVVGVRGFASALIGVGWMRDHGGVFTLHGFCVPSATRKALGKVVRHQLLHGASCAACGSQGGLVIDHKVPVVRGGSCDMANLQAMCAPCNRAKGRKTMDEFMATRRIA